MVLVSIGGLHIFIVKYIVKYPLIALKKFDSTLCGYFWKILMVFGNPHVMWKRFFLGHFMNLTILFLYIYPFLLEQFKEIVVVE